MRNPFTVFKYFLVYRRQVLKNQKYLAKQHGLNIDKIYRMWTVVDLSMIPEEIVKSVGKEAAILTELKKYINLFNKDLNFLELDELVNMYEIKPLADSRYGITFGYKLYNNALLYLWFLGIILTLVTAISLLIFL